MVTYKRRQSRFLALVVAAVAFVLTACRIDATVEVHTDGSVKTAMVFEDTDNTLTITSYDKLGITGGGGTYNPAKKSFTLWYTIEENGHTYRTEATLTKSNK